MVNQPTKPMQPPSREVNVQNAGGYLQTQFDVNQQSMSGNHKQIFIHEI